MTLGLLTWRKLEFYTEDGEERCREVRCRPHLAGTSRYRYHKSDDGSWVRNDKPEPRHWGWLTVDYT